MSATIWKSVHIKNCVMCIQRTGNCRGNGAAQGSNGCHGNLLAAVLVWARVSSGNHVGLEQGALQVDVVVGQGLVDGSQDLLGDVLTALQVVVTIGENLRLDDGHDAMLRQAGTEGQKCLLVCSRLSYYTVFLLSNPCRKWLKWATLYFWKACLNCVFNRSIKLVKSS